MPPPFTQGRLLGKRIATPVYALVRNDMEDGLPRRFAPRNDRAETIPSESNTLATTARVGNEEDTGSIPGVLEKCIKGQIIQNKNS